MKIRLGKRLNEKQIFIIGAVIIIILGVIITSLVYFGKKNKITEPKPDDSIIQEPVEEPEKTPNKLKIVDEKSTSRPFAIMINNINIARPLQSGLQDAYLIYEMIVEGGITRYMALFMDQNTARIGSIRSARHYYLDYALENDAIYVHHGQSPEAASDFKSLNVDRIVVDNNKTGWRDKSLHVSSEHTLFTSISKLQNGLGKLRTTRKNGLLLNYSVEEIDLSTISTAIPANNVNIKYSNYITSSYVYDATNGYYLRSVNGQKHADYVTKEQYHFKNIITYQVSNYTLNDGENKGRQELENIGSGTGYYITNGYAIPINWSKSSRSQPTKYTLPNGEELKVNDGNTFIQIQPKNQTLTIN